MTRARTLIRRHRLSLASPLWVGGVLLGIAIAEGVLEVVRKEWGLSQNAKRADRMARYYDQNGHMR